VLPRLGRRIGFDLFAKVLVSTLTDRPNLWFEETKETKAARSVFGGETNEVASQGSSDAAGRHFLITAMAVVGPAKHTTPSAGAGDVRSSLDVVLRPSIHPLRLAEEVVDEDMAGGVVAASADAKYKPGTGKGCGLADRRGKDIKPRGNDKVPQSLAGVQGGR
jgi:hypothetical protein